MLKAADALYMAGHQVRVVSTRHVDWATLADDELRKTRSWDWPVVDYHAVNAKALYWKTGVCLKGARMLTSVLGASRSPLPLAAWAHRRAHPELVRAVLAEPSDLIYGGGGALSIPAIAARKAGVPYALDLEDFHSAEQEDSSSAQLSHALAERIEHAVLKEAVFLTAGSQEIAAAYAAKYDVRPLTINNTFPLPLTEPCYTFSPGNQLRLYWFSQTIGPRRGLEDAVRAMGVAKIPGELHLRGNPSPGYLDTLRHLAVDIAPDLDIVHHDPAPPDKMIDLARGYDIGLALEQPTVFNRKVCLTNKAFTYMLAGLALVFTDTPGQRPLAMDLGEGATLYGSGEIEALAEALKYWSEDKQMLSRAKKASWEAAKRRWHWEHPEERGTLLQAVGSALNHQEP